MDKRLAKRHKRQVQRQREKVVLSEPDVRTHEQIEAAREASRAPGGRSTGSNVGAPNLPMRSGKAPGTGSAAKTDA